MSLLINNKITALLSNTSGNRTALPSPLRMVSAPTKNELIETTLRRPICLTFDDGPDPVYTPKILKVLADYNVKATFFVVGQAAEKFPHLIEQICSAGHSIGNHTYSHRHPWLISVDSAKQEVIQTNLIIKNILGIKLRWFRPPFGRLRRAMCMQAHSDDMSTVLWSRSIIDWGVLGTKAAISERLDKIESGDIVLMHDGRPEHNHPDITYQCLPKFLARLADKSLIPRALDEVF